MLLKLLRWDDALLKLLKLFIFFPIITTISSFHHQPQTIPNNTNTTVTLFTTVLPPKTHHKISLQDVEVEGYGPFPPPGMPRWSSCPQANCKYITFTFSKSNVIIPFSPSMALLVLQCYKCNSQALSFNLTSTCTAACKYFSSSFSDQPPKPNRRL